MTPDDDEAAFYVKLAGWLLVFAYAVVTVGVTAGLCYGLKVFERVWR